MEPGPLENPVFPGAWAGRTAPTLARRRHSMDDGVGVARIASVLAAAGISLAAGCAPSQPNELDKLGTVRMLIQDQPYELWIADAAEERERGLMFITAEQMAPLPDGTRRGMIFVFPFEQVMSFWMKNTIIPLDIAFLDSRGRVVATHTMAPLDTQLGKYSSREPARYAIEVNADELSGLGAKVGDMIDLPSSLQAP